MHCDHKKIIHTIVLLFVGFLGGVLSLFFGLNNVDTLAQKQVVQTPKQDTVKELSNEEILTKANKIKIAKIDEDIKNFYKNEMTSGASISEVQKFELNKKASALAGSIEFGLSDDLPGFIVNDLLKYTNNSLGFSVSYPMGWDVIDTLQDNKTDEGANFNKLLVYNWGINRKFTLYYNPVGFGSAPVDINLEMNKNKDGNWEAFLEGKKFDYIEDLEPFNSDLSDLINIKIDDSDEDWPFTIFYEYQKNDKYALQELKTMLNYLELI